VRHRGLANTARLVLVAVAAAAGLTAIGPATPAAAATAPLTFHNGGHVQHHPKVFVLLWGPKWSTDNPNTADETALRTLFTDIAGTAYNNILTQYTDGSASHHVYNDTTLAGFSIDSNPPTANLNMYAIAHEAWDRVHQSNQLSCLPNAGCSTWLDGYTKWGPDTQIMVIPQQDSSYSTSSTDPSALAANTCGAHDNASTTPFYGISGDFPFSVVRFGSDSPCTAPLAYTGDSWQASLTSTASHEYAETVTDPAINAWYNSTGARDGEVADLCENDTSPVQLVEDGGYYVSQLWDNSNSNNDPTTNCAVAVGYDSFNLGCASPPMHTVDPDFYLGVYASLGSNLGCPLSEKYTIAGGYGQDFTLGKIYSDGASPPRIREIHGAINSEYQSIRGPNSNLKFPTSNEQDAPGGGRENTFAGPSCGSGAAILWTPSTGAHEMQGCIYNAYMTTYKGPGGVAGYPTQDEKPISGGYVNYMAGSACGSSHGSAIYWNGAASLVRGCAYQTYKANGETTTLGFPLGDESDDSSGWHQYFQNGQIDNGVVTYYQTFPIINDNENPGRCVGINSSGYAGIWDCTGAEDQTWHWANANVDHWYKLVNGNGQCLGVEGGSVSEGAKVKGGACPNNADQYWAAGVVSSGHAYLLNYASRVQLGSPWAIGCSSGSPANGTQLVQWAPNSSPDQMWNLPNPPTDVTGPA
jgi:hypothetical protein